MRTYAVIGAGGALGAAARWGLSSVTGSSLLPNLIGALALGVLGTLLVEVWPPRRYVRPFLAIGVLGGFTTFSTLMVETFSKGALYALVSVAGGLACVAAGSAAVRAVARR